MNQREMEKEIWSWLYGYALNIGESEAFIETLEEHMSEDLGIPFRDLTDAEYDRMVRAGERVAEIIDRKAGD